MDEDHGLVPDGGPAVDKRRYQSLVGSLMYLVQTTRFDLAFAVGVLARFAAAPGEDHWNAAMRVLQYLQGTKDFKLTLGGAHEGPVMEVFTDSVWGLRTLVRGLDVGGRGFVGVSCAEGRMLSLEGLVREDSGSIV